LSRIFVCVLHSDFAVTEVSAGLSIRSIDIIAAPVKKQSMREVMAGAFATCGGHGAVQSSTIVYEIKPGGHLS
jgi:hypothetical protein